MPIQCNAHNREICFGLWKNVRRLALAFTLIYAHYFVEIFGVGFLKVFLRLYFPWFFLIQELPRVALPFLRLLNSVVIIVGMLCAVVYDWTVTKQLNKLPMLFYHNYNCSNRIEYRKNAKYRHYCIAHLYEFLYSLKSRKKEKPTFLPIFIVSAKKKLYAIRCEFGAPGFIALYLVCTLFAWSMRCEFLFGYSYGADIRLLARPNFFFLWSFFLCAIILIWQFFECTSDTHISSQWMQWNRFTAVEM